MGGAVELTVPAAVARAAREFGDAEALAEPGRAQGLRLSYRELDERVTAVTGALIDAGIGPGDRVALWAPNGCRVAAHRAGHAGRGRGAGPGEHAVHRARGAGRDRPQRRAGAVRGRRLPRRGPAGRAAGGGGAPDGGAWTGSALVVRVPEEWDAFLQARAEARWRLCWPRRGGARGGAAGGRQRHHVHLGHHRAEQGRDDLARAVPGRGPGLGGLRAAWPGRPVPGGEPVLPHVRLQGGHPGLPGQRGGAGAAGGLRRGRGDAAGRRPSGSPCCPGRRRSTR